MVFNPRPNMFKRIKETAMDQRLLEPWCSVGISRPPFLWKSSMDSASENQRAGFGGEQRAVVLSVETGNSWM